MTNIAYVRLVLIFTVILKVIANFTLISYYGMDKIFKLAFTYLGVNAIILVMYFFDDINRIKITVSISICFDIILSLITNFRGGVDSFNEFFYFYPITTCIYLLFNYIFTKLKIMKFIINGYIGIIFLHSLYLFRKQMNMGNITKHLLFFFLIIVMNLIFYIKDKK